MIMVVNIWEKEWGLKSLFLYGLINKCGVVILILLNIDFKVIDIIRDNEG